MNPDVFWTHRNKNILLKKEWYKKKGQLIMEQRRIASVLNTDRAVTIQDMFEAYGQRTVNTSQ